MNLIYLTTHVYEEDFAALSAKQSRMPNPAGQNFHGKLIRALAKQNDVHVYSALPLLLSSLGAKGFTTKDNVHYSYLMGPSNRYVRGLLFPRSIIKAIAKENKGRQCVLLYDSLNRALATAAIALGKKLSCPTVAILTDDAANISGVDASFCAKIQSLVSKSSASIALTNGLVQTYGLEHRPHYVRSFVTESLEIEAKTNARPYLYFGGALFIKDGTQDLLDCYPLICELYDLILSGHGPMEQTVLDTSKRIPGIIYLGQIPKEEHYAYIKGSALAINPRHYKKELDENAVPYKVMEYLRYAPYIA